MEEKTNPNQLQSQLLSLLVPEEILVNFEVHEIKDKSSNITIELIEKAERIPELLKGKKAVLDGFISNLELRTFPIRLKRCYLKLKRRRWKEQGTDGKQSYWNEYDFAAQGTKATKAFGAFLKEIHS